MYESQRGELYNRKTCLRTAYSMRCKQNILPVYWYALQTTHTHTEKGNYCLRHAMRRYCESSWAELAHTHANVHNRSHTQQRRQTGYISSLLRNGYARHNALHYARHNPFFHVIVLSYVFRVRLLSNIEKKKERSTHEIECIFTTLLWMRVFFSSFRSSAHWNVHPQHTHTHTHMLLQLRSLSSSTSTYKPQIMHNNNWVLIIIWEAVPFRRSYIRCNSSVRGKNAI